MNHTAQSLTQEVLTKMFGDSSDWYSVLKNGKRVGSFADLRKAVLDKQERDRKKAKRAEEQSTLNKHNTKRSIEDTKRFFESSIKNGKVFINRTQPNIHINDCKCYIVCGPTNKIRLGIMHHTKSFDEMQNEAGIKGLPNMSKNHILFDNIDLDEAKALIDLLCGK
ncbi:inhibitor of host transcription [Acinetobacter phage Acj9]|uniref:Alc inhibitor of host transcription n=1 Tax=Acinetobacter phage Acj9 TaxID=760939 RepID=E5EQ06_9CAUD|nr:inhibitor of host transcription [Acinetobacter phage Acj9]ADG60122.1 Alc inhibitor of host transcription [Acinetobacter phage Acj9]